jgi:LacI family gluconate utilization system Gnt-I transcriptional repressor
MKKVFKKKINIKDIAKETGFSMMTVSRALSNPEKVSKLKRDKIDQVIKKRGYIPNLFAGNLKSGKSGFIMVIIPTLRTSIFNEYFSGLRETLDEQNFQPLVGITDYSLEKEELIINKFLGYKPEGIIVVGTKHSKKTREILLRSNVPLIETWDLNHRPLDIIVGYSNYEAGYNITDYALKQNYKKILFVTASYKFMQTEVRGAKRFRGFVDRMTKENLKFENFQISDPLDYIKSGKEIFSFYKKHKSKIDCIITFNEMTGHGILSVALKNNIKVPKQLGIAGIGNGGLTDILENKLTTVNTNRYLMGKLAASKLIERINGQTLDKRIFDVGTSIVKGFSL